MIKIGFGKPKKKKKKFEKHQLNFVKQTTSKQTMEKKAS